MTDNAIPLEEFIGPRKPCPFCGSTDLELNCWEEYLVCKKCDASAPFGQWQFRAYETELAALKADLERVREEAVMIRLGRGELEVADGNHGGIPALIFGKNGSGVIGKATEPNRTMEPGEALAIITFGNLESLEVVQRHIDRLRDHLLGAALAPEQKG